jgi:hypothetical protein
MVEGNYEGDDKCFLLKRKHRKIQQTPSHTSIIVATNNFETLTFESKMAFSQNIVLSLET